MPAIQLELTLYPAPRSFTTKSSAQGSSRDGSMWSDCDAGRLPGLEVGDAVIVDQAHFRERCMALRRLSVLILEQQAGAPFLISRPVILAHDFHEGVVVPPISTSTEKMRRPLLSMTALAQSPLRSTTMRSHIFLGSPDRSRPLQKPISARAAELEVKEIDAHDFAVATKQAEAAFHVPRSECAARGY